MKEHPLTDRTNSYETSFGVWCARLEKAGCSAPTQREEICFKEGYLAALQAQSYGPNNEAESLLYEALQQLDYLHQKFTKTGTGEAVIARINAYFAQRDATKDAQ